MLKESLDSTNAIVDRNSKLEEYVDLRSTLLSKSALKKREKRILERTGSAVIK
jgi:hypothetical protein